jgi:hypothetical protein
MRSRLSRLRYHNGRFFVSYAAIKSLVQSRIDDLAPEPHQAAVQIIRMNGGQITGVSMVDLIDMIKAARFQDVRAVIDNAPEDAPITLPEALGACLRQTLIQAARQFARQNRIHVYQVNSDPVTQDEFTSVVLGIDLAAAEAVLKEPDLGGFFDDRADRSDRA